MSVCVCVWGLGNLGGDDYAGAGWHEGLLLLALLRLQLSQPGTASLISQRLCQQRGNVAQRAMVQAYDGCSFKGIAGMNMLLNMPGVQSCLRSGATKIPTCRGGRGVRAGCSASPVAYDQVFNGLCTTQQHSFLPWCLCHCDCHHLQVLAAHQAIIMSTLEIMPRLRTVYK